MGRLIDGDALEREGWSLCRTFEKDKDTMVYEVKKPSDFHTIEPEPIKEGLLPDGTLHLFTDTDLSKVDRVWISQNGTHFGDLYYADGEPKIGKWERHYSRPNVYADMCWHCSNCGYKTPDNWANKWKFCPNCGARMQEGEEHDKG